MKEKLEILYEDPHIIVCFKPHGLATQSRKAGVPDLEHLILNHLAGELEAGHAGSVKQRTDAARRRRTPYLAVIHRLDQPVSGILVFAKTPAAAADLNHQLQKEGFGKHYLAQTDGIPVKTEETLIDYMVKDGRSNTSRICDRHTPGAREARLTYRVLSAEGSGEQPQESTSGAPPAQTTLEVILDTGRHHQIRVQLAHHGLPIIGDTKYHPKAAQASGWQTIKLCAYKLTFRHPVTARVMEFQTEDH